MPGGTLFCDKFSALNTKEHAMPSHHFTPRSWIALFLLACSLLVGCGGGQGTSNILRPGIVSSPGGSQQTGPSTSQFDRWVSPVVLRNPSPGQLERYFN